MRVGGLFPASSALTKQDSKMKLYIANCSKQDHTFTYMLPENPRPFLREIKAGCQVEFDGDSDMLNAIVNQHSVYGLQNVKKIERGFGGLCYQFDKVISIDAIKSGFTQNEQEMIERSQKQKEITAAAADHLLATKAQEFGITQSHAYEIEIMEEKNNAVDDGEKLHEIISVKRDGLKEAPKRGRPKK